MFPQSVFARKTMIFAVALVSIFAVASAGGRSFNMCGLQKNTPVQQYKLNTLYPFFGEVLTTESNNNIYVVSICQPVPKMFYDPRKLSGVIKLTPKGNTIDLGHINQSNVIVNENSIVLTYVGGDRDRDVEDTCRGLRWLTYLMFRCDPKAVHDILTLIDEDPDQPEICQVWFEIRTSKICNRQSYLPFVVAGKDFSASKYQTDHEERKARESTNSNEISSRENEFDYDTSNIDNNNKTSNTENKEKPNINELYNKFKKSFRNEHFSTSKENKTTNDEIKNGKKPQIISKDQKKQPDNESKDNYKESVTEKNEKEEAKGSNSQTNTTENKMSADHEINTFWIETNNTVPGMPSNKEYSYPEKKEIISQYNNMKKYLNQNKNSEGKYENSVLRESTEDDENKDGKLNQKFPEDVSKNDTKYEKPINNENMEKTSRQNTFENQTSNKEMNDSNDNEKMVHQDGSKKSNLNNNPHTHNGISNSDNGIKNNTTNEGKIADTEDNQNQSKDNTSIIYDNNVPSDKTKENIANKTHLQNNSSETKSFKKEDQKNEIENHPKNVNSSITESTPRADSTTKNISTGSGHKAVDANTINTPKPKTNDGNPTIDANKNNTMKNNYNSTSGSDDNTIAVIVKPSETSPSNTVVNDYTNESGKVNVSSTESPVDGSLNNIKTNNKSTGSGHKDVDANTINTPKPNTNDGNPTIDANKNNTMKNNYNSTSGSDDNTIAVIVKPSETSPSNTVVNDYTNESGKVNVSSTESPVDGSLNNIKTNNKSTGSGHKDVDANTINTTKPNTNDGNPTIDANKNNTMKNNYNSTSGSDDNTISVIVKPSKTSPSNTVVNDYTNESGEVNVSSTESPVDVSLNNIKTNNKSELNGTIINETNNVNKNLQPDILSNGIHVSASIIILALALLVVVILLIGTAINRYYYKLSGTDQIPFKGTMQSIFNFIKVIILSICCCCCRRSSYDDLEAPNLTNEKTPLLQPKFNISSPLLEDETSKKSSDSGANDDNNKQNSNKEYGSMSKEKKSSTTEIKYQDINIGGKVSTTFTEKVKSAINSITEKVGGKVESTDEIKKDLEKITKDAALISKFVENEKSTVITEKVGGKVESTDEIKKNLDKITKDSALISKFVENEKSTVITEKVGGKVESTDEIKEDLDKITKDSALISKFVENEKSTVITEKVGGKVESTDEIKEDLDKITKDSALISKFVENEKSTVITDDVRVDVEIIPENNLEKTHLNGIETQNAVVQEDIKSITLGESQQSSNVTPLSEVIVSQLSVSDLQQIKKNEQASEKTSTVDRVETEEVIESTHKKKDINIENNIEINLDTVVTSTTDNKTSINESKLMSLGFEKEDKNVKVVTDKSISSNKKIENEEDDVEVIEEIIYVDGVAGEEDEEIIEEIIETTTIEDSPDLLGESGSGHTKVTVHTTRKISSTSLPGEVKTTEETVVTDGIPGIPEIERKLSGFQLGIGKSGISMSVDDKKMEIGKSGLDFIPSRNKSPTNVEGDEPDKRDKRSPEKSKSSATLSKVFKRSISHPTDDDIQEVEDESASTRKFSVTSSGLLKSGKSRSKSTLIVKTGDVTIDTKEMSNFIENERKMSRISNVGLGELDLTVSDEGVAAAVVVGETSTTTSEGKDTPASSSEPAKDLQSTENAETKSDAKTKREKKDKTKLTTLSRPF